MLISDIVFHSDNCCQTVKELKELKML